MQRSHDALGIHDLRIAKTGSLGAIESSAPYGSNPSPLTYTVIAVTAEGGTVLDSGLDVDADSLALGADSLALGGSWLYWTRAGEPHSAPLP